jgi:circadian clock protein KaiB
MSMPPYHLVLYVNGNSTSSEAAIANVREVCDALLGGEYSLDIIDIREEPSYIRSRDILVSPTLDKEEPAPARRIVGDLSDRERVAQLLALPSRPDSGGEQRGGAL